MAGFLGQESRPLLCDVLATLRSTHECNNEVVGVGGKGHAAISDPVRSARTYSNLLYPLDVAEQGPRLPIWKEGG